VLGNTVFSFTLYAKIKNNQNKLNRRFFCVDLAGTVDWYIDDGVGGGVAAHTAGICFPVPWPVGSLQCFSRKPLIVCVTCLLVGDFSIYFCGFCLLLFWLQPDTLTLPLKDMHCIALWVNWANSFVKCSVNHRCGMSMNSDDGVHL